MYVLNKLFKMKRPCDWSYLHQVNLAGQPCFHKCAKCEVDPKPCCEEWRKVQNDCMQCTKNKPYEFLKTDMVGGPSIIFCWYHESGKSQIPNYTDARICDNVVGFDANSLCLYFSGQEMPCIRKNTQKSTNLMIQRSYATKSLAESY